MLRCKLAHRTADGRVGLCAHKKGFNIPDTQKKFHLTKGDVLSENLIG